MLLAMFAVVYLCFRGRAVTNVVRTCSPSPLSIYGNKICLNYANLRKTNINNTYLDLVNDNVYTKSGQNLFIRSQDIEQKLNSDVNQGL